MKYFSGPASHTIHMYVDLPAWVDQVRRILSECYARHTPYRTAPLYQVTCERAAAAVLTKLVG